MITAEDIIKEAKGLTGMSLKLTNYNYHKAEDLRQEVIYACYRGLDGFKELSSLKTWMSVVMIRKNIDRVKSEALRANINCKVELIAHPVSECNQLEDLFIDDLVKMANCILKPRELKILKDLGFGYSVKEIATRYCLKIGACHTAIFRIRQKMRNSSMYPISG